MIRNCTEVEGPGKRFCIWLQGCNLGCKNCINDQMLNFEVKNIMSIKDLQEYILVSKKIHYLEGITFLGGEPFLQANSLKHIAKFCKEKGLSVMCFSGFKYERLKQNVVDGSNELLTYLDVLIDGPYIDSLRDNCRNWVGSSNQTFYYLSNYYNSSIETDNKYKNKLEITILNDKISINGEANLTNEVIKYLK